MTKLAIKPIRSETDYTSSLALLETLMDAEPNTPESDALGVLAVLIEQYEDKRFPITAPTPLGAIRFRMEQLNLTTRDLVPLIGSRSRVSEVMNGQRPLSIDMIRAISKHWKIPADILIAEEIDSDETPTKSLSKPVQSIINSWKFINNKESLSSIINRAFGSSQQAMAMLRKTRTPRTNAKTDVTALQAWIAASVIRSNEIEVKGKFDKNSFDKKILRDIAKLSALENGPAIAKSYLSERGVALVILPHLPGTHLDGAAIMRNDGTPVISMTLRKNRIDNFWFTLLHECAHVSLHLNASDQVIVDDLEISSSDDKEQEADNAAQIALIPDEILRNFSFGKFCSLETINEIAKKAKISPAIVAGRWQMHNKDFRKFSKLLGHGTVKDNFPEYIDI